MTGWLANIILIVGALLIGEKNRKAFLFVIVGEGLWIFRSVELKAWDMLACCLVFLFLAIRNYFKWAPDFENPGPVVMAKGLSRWNEMSQYFTSVFGDSEIKDLGASVRLPGSDYTAQDKQEEDVHNKHAYQGRQESEFVAVKKTHEEKIVSEEIRYPDASVIDGWEVVSQRRVVRDGCLKYQTHWRKV